MAGYRSTKEYENGFNDFDKMISPSYRAFLSNKNSKLAAIPVISYDMQEPAINKLTDLGCFFLKIKIGHADTPKEMLEKDKARMTFIHNMVGKVHSTTQR